MKIKILSGLIIFSMLFTLFIFSSCNSDNTQNNGGDNKTETNNPDAATDANINETTELKNPISEDVKFNGDEIRILNCTYFQEEIKFVHTEEENGDIVNDSIYQRNMKVQNDLNINFKFIDIALQNAGNFNSMVKKSVNAGSDDYDILFGVQYDAVQLATNGVYMNIKDAPYIDLEKPWWPSENIQEEYTIGKNVLYFLTGDISLNFIRNMGCAYFNRQLYSDYFGNSDDMYKLVLDGKWTFDKLGEMCKGLYKDLNGDGQTDDGDQYGGGVITQNITDHLTFSSGIRVTERDSEGLPYLIMNNEKTIEYTQKLYNLFYNNEGIRVYISAEDTNNILIPGKFKNNELLFDFGWFYISELLRDMETDYGIIPYPKYDESQPTYLSLAHDIVPVYCVPATCQKLDAVGAILESMSFESYKTLLPAYYEIALKIKYNRDTNDDAFTVIDMIHDNCTTDFAYIYNFSLNSIGHIMRELMAAKSADFVSKYEQNEPKVQKSLDKIINAYLETE